jgi:predicted DNA-binding transcriptional regulator AlpA
MVKGMVMRASRTLTVRELIGLPVSVDLITAGKAFGLSRAGSYELHARGEFPCQTLRVGRFIRVARAELLRVLGVADVPSSDGGGK